MCKTHANMELLLEKLFTLKLLSNKSSLSFIKSKVCNIESKECAYGQCEKCKNKEIVIESNDTPTYYNKWITRKVTRTGAKEKIYNVNFTSKEKIDCTVNDLIKEFNSQISEFIKHAYDAGHQHRTLNNIKQNLKPHEVLVVIDFSENYECKCHKEIQSSHFGASKKQVSLHTGAFCYRTKSGAIEVVSFCTASEELSHEAPSIWAHLDPVLKLIKKTVPGVRILHVQSDGPSSQYKNKTNFWLFEQHCKKMGLHIATWNFTCPGHGKSIADGIGAAVKTLCNGVVERGGDVISAKCMVDIVNSSKNKKIKAFLIEKSDIESVTKQLPDKNAIKSAPSAPSETFQIVWTHEKPTILHLNYLSCSYCVVNKLYNPACQHFSLKRTWSFSKIKEKPIRKIAIKKTIDRKKITEVIETKNEEKKVVNKKNVKKESSASIINSSLSLRLRRKCTRNT